MTNDWGVALVIPLLVLAGCSTHHERQDGLVVVVRGGVSEPVTVPLAEGTTAVLVVVEGDEDALYGLASLVFADGAEHGTDIAFDDDMRTIGGGWAGEAPDLQVLRMGTFAFQYPVLASQPAPNGSVTLRVASDRDGPVRVHVVATTGAPRRLHVSLVSFSEATTVSAADPRFVSLAAELLERAGIELVVDERIDAGARAPLPRSDSFPRPGDAGEAVERAARALLDTDALPIVLMEFDDDNAFGMARGLPTAPEGLGDYRCVILDATPSMDASPDLELFRARTLTHELGHALGLPHPEDITLDGAPLLDPFNDTTGFDDTVMGSVLLGAPLTPSALRFSPRQVFMMQRSALLD